MLMATLPAAPKTKESAAVPPRSDSVFENEVATPGMLPLFAAVMFQVWAMLVPMSVSLPAPPSNVVGTPRAPRVKTSSLPPG